VVLASSCSIVLTRFLSLPDPPTVLCRLSISVLEVSLVSILKHPGHLLTPSFALAWAHPFLLPEAASSWCFPAPPVPFR